MADFFDKLKKGIDKTISVAGQKSGELMEAGKLNAQILALKNDKKKAIAELGETTYNMLKSESFELELLEDKFKEIAQIEKQIEEKEKEKEKVTEAAAAASEKVLCAECGAENEAGAAFCAKCGAKLGE